MILSDAVKAPASSEELLVAIASGLGSSKHSEIRDDLEVFRADFLEHFDGRAEPLAARDKFEEIRKSCLKAAKALSLAPQEIDWISTSDRLRLDMSVSMLAATLGMIAERAGAAAARMQMPNARKAPQKDACALYAYLLMKGHSSEVPTASPEGSYLTIASLVLELMTGRSEENLEASCRKVLRSKEEGGKGRRANRSAAG